MADDGASGKVAPDATSTAPRTLSAPSAPAVPTDLFPDNSGLIAEKASAAGDDQRVRNELRKQISDELDMCRIDASRQFEQAVVWRRMNIGLGLAVGLLVAAAGTSALFSKTWAAIVALLASFGTGALATVNTGQRKTQALTAANAYEEIETSARELLDLELPYLPLADAIRRTQLLTTHRLLTNRGVEPPSTPALARSNRHQNELRRYGRSLSFSERSRFISWVRRPAEIDHRHAADRVHAGTGSPSVNS
jgi:hypothetical protein